MKSISVFVLIFLILSSVLAQSVLAQRQTQDVFGLLRPWTQTINTSGQNMGQQLLKALQTSFERWNQMGDQITTSVGTQLEQIENQIHSLAKEFRLSLMNHNLLINNTQITKN